MLVATISVGRRVFTGGQPPKVRPTKSRRSCGVAVDGMCTSNAAVKSTTIIVFFRRRLLKLGEVRQSLAEFGGVCNEVNKNRESRSRSVFYTGRGAPRAGGRAVASRPV